MFIIDSRTKSKLLSFKTGFAKNRISYPVFIFSKISCIDFCKMRLTLFLATALLSTFFETTNPNLLKGRSFFKNLSLNKGESIILACFRLKLADNLYFFFNMQAYIAILFLFRAILLLITFFPEWVLILARNPCFLFLFIF